MGRRSAVKGARGERELQKIFSTNGYDLKRGGTQSYGQRPDLYGLPFVHIEVKRVERVSIPAWYEQAKRDAMRFQDGCPTLFHRRNGEPWLVTMPLTAWMELYKSYERQHR